MYIFVDQAEYQCYYCIKQAVNGKDIFDHCVRHHAKENFSLRKLFFCENTGQNKYKLVHFGKTPETICDWCQDVTNIIIDCDNIQIRYKRGQKELGSKEDHSPGEADDSSQGAYSEDKITYYGQLLMSAMKETGRPDDLVSLLKGITEKRLPSENIALHLVLDIGQFLSLQTTSCMRYSNVSLTFWTLVQKLFGEKAIRFFRGFMGSGKISEKTRG